VSNVSGLFSDETMMTQCGKIISVIVLKSKFECCCYNWRATERLFKFEI